MDTIRSWAISACAAMIVSSIFGIIMPKSSMQKIIRLGLAAYVLFVLFIPVSDIASVAQNIGEEYFSQESIILPELENAIENRSEGLLSESISEYVEQTAIALGAENASAQTVMHTDETGCISIECIRLVTKADDSVVSVLEKRIEARLGIVPEIERVGE